ncbi:PLP-dependent cysteine synthase family protein, partial [Rhodococcus hoagii]|nr:PLP-dependent cysteine synthase family protein [Prescottella equi]
MTAVLDRRGSRAWVDNAVRPDRGRSQRSADTHLLRYPQPGVERQLYLKDESTHITGSLK